MKRGYCAILRALAVLMLLFSICGVSSASDGDILDVRVLYQDPFFYIRENPRKLLLSRAEQARLQVDFEARYFSPWNPGRESGARDVLEWVFRHFSRRSGYGQNLRLLGEPWLDAFREQAGLDRCGEVGRSAVAVVPTSLRLLPTEEPFFFDPGQAGEGYPFDYLQNSRVHPGEPLYLSHFSRDGDWAFVEASYASGWVPARDVARAGETFRRAWRRFDRVAITREGLVLKDEEGRFLSRASVGTILPVTGRKSRSFLVAVPVRDFSGEAHVVEAPAPCGAVSPFPVSADAWNVTGIASQMMGQPYGWGGFLGKRDCSATVRDLFLPFGIWLPRNSGAQAKAGRFVSFKGLGRQAKESLLLEEGIPFVTLVTMRGHIMLYVGEREGRPLVLHNTWGLKTRIEGREGRHIIGKTVITTLTPGRELPDLDRERGLLIDRVTGMTFIGPFSAEE